MLFDFFMFCPRLAASPVAPRLLGLRTLALGVLLALGLGICNLLGLLLLGFILVLLIV